VEQAIEGGTVHAPAKAAEEHWSGDEPGRRGQIVRAATTVLGRQGYAETSLKDVAREAGVAPGLLHYYFESKQELLLEVVVALEREMTRDWQAAVSNVDDPLERIVAALDHAAQRCSEKLIKKQKTIKE